RNTKRKIVSSADTSDASYNDDESSGVPAAAGAESVSDDVALSDVVATEDDSDNLDAQIGAGARARQPSTYDDGNELAYQERLYAWCAARWQARLAAGDARPASSDAGNRAAGIEVGEHLVPKSQLANEPFLADPGALDYTITAHERSAPSLFVPRQIWDRLLEYQKASLRWMYTLHQQNAGGILGDEMGLGKTVQVAAFLASMYHSQLLSQPSIIVCPATLMRQWVREFHAWWPALRVVILHNTGHGLKHGLGEDDGRDTARDLRYNLMDSQSAHQAASVRAASTSAAAVHGFKTASGSPSRVDYTSMPAAAALDGFSGCNSSDEYEYDAYGSRVRRKRRPKGYVDWSKKKLKQKKKPRAVTRASRESLRRAELLVEHAQRHGHIVIATYSGLQVYRDVLLRRKWGYAVLDEGHMIRNPDAEATLACKGLDTRHRILVSGTPIQNNLTELWSLFDFIFPGRLGTLPVFNNQFVVPITVGGYASANTLQVRAGYRCACVLRDLIDPYLLRRLKADVAQDLPQKTEHVLFCRLTPMQRTAYIGFLRSNDMDRILSGKLQMLFGVDVARKICDHPDLLLLSTLPSAAVTHREASGKGRRHASSAHADRERDHGALEDDRASEHDLAREVAPGDHLPAGYGDWHRSGKLTIMRALLEMWKPHGHRVLVFSQTRQMLDIIERMVSAMPQMIYRRMDGSTPVQNRSAMVDEYNASPDIFVFLLTTKVGGVGINLTGADRVILYSPDWNPSSDMQARERAWRLGQTRDVAIYRLMTAGTIEEKIYNRQIYKQLLSNKILADPNQKQFFHSQSLRDLFSLSGFDPNESITGRRSNAGVEVGAGRSFAQAPGSNRLEPAADAGGESDSERTTETGRMFANARLYPRASTAPQAVGEGDMGVDAGNGVESIGGVVRLEPYWPPEKESSSGSGQTNGSSSEAAAGRTQGAEGEDRVLQSLFKMSGVHSALKHDAIVNGKDDEPHVVEQEAERIASEARRALRDSQRARREVDVYVPTWTGMSGHAGMPLARSQRGSGRPGVPAVAPPPRALMSSEQRLPSAEVGSSSAQYEIGRSNCASAAKPSSASIDSAIYNPTQLSRWSAADRRPPSSSVVPSLSLASQSRPAQVQAQTQGTAAGKFGDHAVSGVYNTGGSVGGLSSASLLAGLKARSADIRPPAATTSAAGPRRSADFCGTKSQIIPASSRGSSRAPSDAVARSVGLQPRQRQRDQIQRLPGFASQSRGASMAGSPAGAATSWPHGAGADLRQSAGQRVGVDQPRAAGHAAPEAMAAPTERQQIRAEDRAVVSEIRAILLESGGELSNGALVERLRSRLLLPELPRLKDLALMVADLEQQQPMANASRIGMGRIVQRVWKLRRSNAEGR
ncbi:DNA repair protein rhp26, partial [Coemansia thaxteri]